VKSSGGRAGGGRKHHFREMRQPSPWSANDSGPVIHGRQIFFQGGGQPFQGGGGPGGGGKKALKFSSYWEMAVKLNHIL
jgi:hypothetical protein